MATSSLHKGDADADIGDSGIVVEKLGQKPTEPVLEGRCREKWYQLWLPSKSPRAPYPSIDDAPDIPVATASFLTLLTFGWITEIMVIGWQRPLQIGDLWKMDETRRSQLLASKLADAWEKRKLAADQWNAALDAGEKRPGTSRRMWWKIKARGSAEKGRALEEAWRIHARRTPEILWALSDVFGFQFWLGGLFKITADISQLGGPLVSKTIIQYAQKRAQAKADGTVVPSIARGIGAAVGLFCLTVIASVCQHQWFWRSMSTGILGRASLINSLYKRGLALSPKSRTVHPNGALVNHLSTDISRIDYLFQWAHPAWTAPIQVIVCLVILCCEMGPSALAGFSLFLLLTPLQERAMSLQLKMRRGSMKFTDQRANLLQEILGAMRITKLFTYEKPFWDRISAIRKDELAGIRTLLIMRAATQAVAFSIPVLASVLAFVVYALSGHDLNPAIIFTCLSLFQLLRQPLMFMPRALSAITDGRNALSRITKVFLADTLDVEIEVDPTLSEALLVKGASFKWESVKADNSGDIKKGKGEKNAKVKGRSGSKKPELVDPIKDQREPFSLVDLNLSVPRGGSIYAVVGPIGCGKSSLLNALIGEMRRTGGKVIFGGSLAYCAQIPWIQNASLRNNVLFGREFDEDRYWKVIRDSCLMTDLELLSDGDLTEIGEKGINLSGGQKARVNLARALYSDADVVCLDDPLSAVDAHVAEKLFTDAILALKSRGKSVVLVTHALHFLPQVDYIYCLSEGRISEEGSYASLIASRGVFSDLMNEFGSNQSKAQGDNYALEDGDESQRKPGKSGRGAAEGTGKKEGILIKKEIRKTGHISGAVYKGYMYSGGGIPVLLLVIVFGVMMQVASVITSYWLVWWQENHFNAPQGFYMGLYAGLGVSQALFTFALGAALSLMSYLASAKMHGNTLRTILHAPMSFFDTTPLGRILSVFGKDMDTIDNLLSDSLRMAVMVLSSLLGSVILISILFPYFLPVIAFVVLGYVALASFYTVSSREMKRLDGILRSHLYSHFAESLSGLATIRAYGATSRFIKENGVLIDHEDSALYLTITNQRWLSIRLDALGGLLVFVVAIMAVEGLNGVSPAQIGLALTYTVSITQILGMVMRQTTEVENNMNAVERVFQYSNEGSTPQEAAYEDDESTAMASEGWPIRGDVQLNNVYMSYRPGLPPVLKGLNLHVEGGQKIGVVGRTGAGKSSMMAVLFRLIEISSGSITIDGVDISKLGLKRLRSRLSIIPQDPLIFSGTIRTNLDPFSHHDDAELWDALRRARVTDGPSGITEKTTSSSRFTLDTIIDAEGANLSVGERSLLSLARALCKDSQVVIMDEATASVDLETDSKIQETILREFKHKTVLCIAHRLRTIINYQKIIVMDQGRVVEFDSPLNLYDQEDGIFRSMCDRSQIRRKEIEAAWNSSSWADSE